MINFRPLPVVLVACCITLIARTQTYYPSIDPAQILQQATPVNPDVAALGRYSMTPPNYSNGLPQQNIPLLEIKENGLSYPLSLFYTYSGFRVKEQASSIGLGWGITEGMIIRVVKHIPDEHPNLMKKFEDWNNNLEPEIGKGTIDPGTYVNPDIADQDFNFTDNRLYYKLYDAQPDLYIYNFAGYSGKFLWLNGAAIQLEQNDIKISGETVNNTTVFTLTTPDGVDYTFNEADKITQTPAHITRTTGCQGATWETYIEYPYTTAWRLTEIRNKTTQAVISFTYGSNIVSLDKDITQISSVTLPAPMRQDGSYFTTDFNKEEIFNRTINQDYYLQEINSDHYKVSFITNSRSDGGQSRIQEIRVYDKQNPTTAVKTVSFTQDYFGNTAAETSCWLRLKKVTIQGSGNNQEYQFSYVNENFTWDDLDKQKLSIDHWGYYNFKGNTTLIPLTGTLQSQLQHESSLGTGIIPWANRDPDFTHACIFALESTQYPTKGFTKISYESADGKGIRVASLEDFDGEKSTFRYFNYGPPFTWPAFYFPETYYTFVDCLPPPGSANIRVTVYGSTPEGALDYYAETDAFYENVMEYIGTPDGKGGRVNYKYQRLPSDYGNKSLLIEKDIYKYGSTDIISQEKYNYLPASLKTINYWMIPEMSTVAMPGGNCSLEPNDRPSCGPLDPVKGFILANLSSSGVAQLNSYWIRLDNTVTTQDNIQVVKRFTYADIDPVTGVPRQIQPVKVEEDLSNGMVKQTFLYYPGDADPDNPSNKLGLPQMWDASNPGFINLISPALKTRTFVNNTLVSKATAQFTADPSTGNILLARQESYPTGADDGKIVTSLKYDSKANVTDIKKDNDLNKAFLWGYNKNYPIATVNNAASNEIFFSSFEEGGWDNGLTAYDNATKHAGRYSGRIDKSTAGDQVSVSTNWLNISRSTPTNFKFSGWVYTTGPVAKIDLLMKTAAETGPYTYISSITSNTSNKWVFIKGEYTVPANVTMLTIRLDNTGGGTVWFDDIRLLPSAAKMVTYTYDPLIGVTSETDVNNRTTSYEYDTYGRLAFLRDQDGNILKKYCYNFYGQPEDCSGLVNVTPYWQYTGETRCKPCPANSNYISKILQKRYKDINPNSQSHDVQIWVDAGESTACVPLPVGQLIYSNCLKDANGNNTGWRYEQTKDINPCSDTYGSVFDGTYYNSNACPLPPPPPPPPPPNCTYDNCTYQEGYKCINDNCQQGYKVITDRYWIEDLQQYEITYHYEFSDGSVSDDYSGYE